MKLLAVFGLALAAVAMEVDESASDPLKPLMRRPQIVLGLLKLAPSNSEYCSQALSMIKVEKINLKTNPEVIFPLIRYCLEAGKLLLPKNLLELDVVYVAAFIFMFRVKGEEEVVELLYNAVMRKRFFEKFKAGLHKALYTLDDLLYFKLSKELGKQFLMLRTVKKYGKSSESEMGVSQSTWLCYSALAALNLMSLGTPPDLLFLGMIVLQKELPVGTTPDSLSNIQLMLFSLTKDAYVGLREPEKAQLLAFLEKYLRLRFRSLNLLEEKLSDKEREQLQLVFDLEDQCKWMSLESYTIKRFAKYFCHITRAGCPAFLLKKMLDFYVRKLSFKGETLLSKRRCFLGALEEALKMVEDVCLKEMEEEERLHEKLVCSEIESTIKVCAEEIEALSMEKPGANECADLKLVN